MGSHLQCLDRNIPRYVTSRNSITTLLQWCIESNQKSKMFWHLFTCHPLVFPTLFLRVIYWSFNWLQWQNGCPHIWTANLTALPSDWRLMTLLYLNTIKYIASRMTSDISQSNLWGSDFKPPIGRSLKLAPLTFDLKWLWLINRIVCHSVFAKLLHLVIHLIGFTVEVCTCSLTVSVLPHASIWFMCQSYCLFIEIAVWDQGQLWLSEMFCPTKATPHLSSLLWKALSACTDWMEHPIYIIHTTENDIF